MGGCKINDRLVIQYCNFPVIWQTNLFVSRIFVYAHQGEWFSWLRGFCVTWAIDYFQYFFTRTPPIFW